MKHILWFVILTITLIGCASRQDVQNLQYNMDRQDQRLEERLVNIEKNLVSTKETVKGQMEEVEPVRSKQADLWSEIESLRIQVGALQGKIEQIEMEMKDLKTFEANSTQTIQSLNKEVELLSRQMAQVSSQLGVDLDNRNATAEPSMEAPSSTDVKEPKDPEKLLYDRALSAFKAREYEKAKNLWGEYVETFTNDPLVPNALFWQGECYYQMQDYAQAILAYDEVIKKFPKSNKIPAALLKQGMSFKKLNKDKAGELLLRDLIKRYPKSAEAKRAKSLLK